MYTLCIHMKIHTCIYIYIYLRHIYIYSCIYRLNPQDGISGELHMVLPVRTYSATGSNTDSAAWTPIKVAMSGSPQKKIHKFGT